MAAEGGPELWAVTVDSNWAVVRDYFSGRVPEAVFRWRNTDVAKRFGVEVLPVTLLMEGDRIVRRYEGARA